MLANKNSEFDYEKLAGDFNNYGYAFIENFLSEKEVDMLRKESLRLIREESIKEHEKQLFGNDENSKSDYFITSGDKVRYFFEKKAFDETTRKLKVSEEESLAKIGHALHCLNPTFRQLTYSEKVRNVFKAIKFEKPTVIQSMVIFKNPKVGGEYTPHQDASFLYCGPIENNLCGIWLALDDADEENGCLEFIPGSHRWPLTRRFVRITRDDGRVELEWTAPATQYDAEKFVRLPVKRGAMVLIHGLVVHRSESNNSDKARWVYTFHAYDESRSVYDKLNWLQIDKDDSKSKYKKEMDKIAQELAAEYSGYFDVDTSSEKNKLSDTVEECLTHLEEVFSLMDDYNQNSVDIESCAEHISSREDSLIKLYSQVNAIEKYLSNVNKLLDQLESSIDTLEQLEGKPVTQKLKQIINLLPLLSTTAFNNLRVESNREDDSDDVALRAQRDELVSRIKQTAESIGKIMNDVEDRLNLVNKADSRAR